MNAALPIFDEETGACTDRSSRFQLETVGRQAVEFGRSREEV